MRVALFIPCYIDQLYPQVTIATMELLERLLCEVVFPLRQTCCGQPMANSGFSQLDEGCNRNFVKNFRDAGRGNGNCHLPPNKVLENGIKKILLGPLKGSKK